MVSNSDEITPPLPGGSTSTFLSLQFILKLTLSRPFSVIFEPWLSKDLQRISERKGESRSYMTLRCGS